MTDLYGVLGVSVDASIDEIRAAFRRLAKKHHPDAGGSVERFQEIELAVRVLTDQEQRAHYDRTGTIKSAEPSIEQRSLALLEECVTAWLTRDAATGIDPVTSIQGRLNDKKRENEQTIRQVASAKGHLEKVVGKIKNTGPTDPIGTMLRAKLEEEVRIRAALEMNRAIIEKALEVLANYTFEQDQPHPTSYRTWSSSMFPNSTISSSR